MQIVNHRIVGAPFVASPNIGGMIDPTYVIKHYTAGWNAESAIATFKSPASKVSAHVVVGRDGAVTQCVPFNRAAWHAGPSRYDGVANLNNHAIGIEIVNIGFLRDKPGAAGVYQLSTGAAWKDVSPALVADLDLAHALRAPHARVGGGTLIWPAYTPAQLDAVKAIFRAIVATYRIKDVTGHEQIDTRGWKVDPGPAFPMGEFKALLHAGAGAIGRNDNQAARGTFRPTATLNVRAKPDTSAAILAVLKTGQDVALIEDVGDWNLIEYAPGKRGYVSERYLRKI